MVKWRHVEPRRAACGGLSKPRIGSRPHRQPPDQRARCERGTRKTWKTTMNARERRRLQRTAYHEAGHAVAAVLLRRPFRYATIMPDDDDSLGHVQYLAAPASLDWDDDNDTRLQRHLERVMMTALAGLVAEARLAGRRYWQQAGHDLDTVRDYALHYCGGNPEGATAYINWLHYRVRVLL